MTDIYQTLADLLEYPNSNWDSKMSACADNDALIEFRSGIATLALSDLQELYTRTFDLNPVCALEIGYHLFGENYKRGEFLASLRMTEAPFDLGQEHQLPDYLPVVLRLLNQLDDQELRASLISECLIPALEKMLKPLSESENPYRHLIEAVKTVPELEAGVTALEPPRLRTRASLPVLTNDREWPSGSASRCAVVAPPHRNDSLQSTWGYAPETRGVAPKFEELRAGRSQTFRTSGGGATNPI